MRINLETKLYDYNNEPLMDRDKDVTLKDVLVAALNYPREEETTIEQKVRIYELSLQIKDLETKEIDLKIDDLALIKKNINSLYNPIIVGQIVKLIDN